MSRTLRMSVTNGNRPTTKYPSTGSPCPTKEETAPEWEFWDLQSQPHTLPLLQVASSQIQLDSSCRASPESPSSAQNTKIGLLISPALFSTSQSSQRPQCSLKESPVGSRTKILRDLSGITERW